MNADGIILAAGFSQRAQQFKPAIDLCGKPLIHRTIESITPVCERVIIVGGHNFEKLHELCDPYQNVEIVKNEHYKDGMFSSVRCGIQEVTAEYFFILPGDQPVVQTATMQQMLTQNADVVVPRFQGKKGHPVLINSKFIPEILAMPQSAVLRDFIHSKEACILDVDDPGIGYDVDTPEDFTKIEAYFKKEML